MSNTSTSFHQLNDSHKSQLDKYMKLCRSKKEEHIAEVLQEFKDIKEYKIIDNIYSNEEIIKFIDQAFIATKAVTLKEFDNLTNSNILLFRHLLLQAEAREIDLMIDIGIVDDESLVKKMNELTLPANKLVPLQNTADINLLNKIKELEDNNRKLEEKSNIQLKTITDLQNQKSNSIADNKIIESLKSEMDILKKELATKVVQTSQFQSLKKMVEKKNEELKIIRTKLKKYEPEEEKLIESNDEN